MRATLSWLLVALPLFGCKEERPPPHLNYYGGPVLPNVKVYAVFWGPNVNSTVRSGVGSFFSDLTNSAHFDGLNEYDTDRMAHDGGPGTDQHIGRGTYAGEITIAPAHPSGTVDMTDISAEVVAQLTAGGLPPPDDDTLFMIFMPPEVTVTDGRDIYCTSNGSCANHTTATFQGRPVPYGLLPDFGPGSGCRRGCGNSPDFFGDLTGNASHELIESVTDPLVDEVPGVARPMAWYDPHRDEIADICDNQDGQLEVPGGATHWVQYEFSNAEESCVLSHLDPVDYALELEPRAVTLAPGGTATVTVRTSVTSGDPGDLVLTLGALPDGVTGSLAEDGLVAGDAAEITLTADASAPTAADFPLVVEADGPSVHTASILLSVGGE